MKTMFATLAMALGVSSIGLATVLPETQLESKIASKLHFVNQEEIKLANEVVTRATREDVKEYAAALSKHHEEGDVALLKLAKEKNIAVGEYVPQTEEEKAELEAHKASVAEVLALQGAEFEQGYLKLMVAAHTKVIAYVEKAIPSVTLSELSTLLTDLLPILNHHKSEAERLLTPTP